MKKVLIICAAILLCTSGGSAQDKIQNSVLGNGGLPVGDAHHRIHGTAGQALVGTVQDASFISGAGYWFQTLGFVTSVEPIPGIPPTEFRLDQNYPNPFNPVTTLRFAVPEPSIVKLMLYDLMGREIAVLMDEPLESGEYNFVFDAADLPSGVYIYRIQAGDFLMTRRLVLMK